MIRYSNGDMFADDCEALVNTVNCVGIMGRGVALQFKNRFPGNFKAYAAACKVGRVRCGRMFVFDTGGLINPRWIINFPTKRHWRGRSRLEDIAEGLDDLVDVVERFGVHSISMPPLGCGLGGLDWRTVKPLIERKLAKIADCDVIVHEPNPSAISAVVSAVAPKMTPGRAALVELVRKYLGAMIAPFVTLLEVHKLMYFLQEAGEPLRLDFVKAPHGPYAKNLSHVLNRIEGYFLYGYMDGGDRPDKQLNLVPHAVEEAEVFLLGQPNIKGRIDRVLDLCEGFESPDGLELLASVHWLVSREGVTDVEAVMRGLDAWGESKRRFTRRQVEIAFERLNQKGFAMPQCFVDTCPTKTPAPMKLA